METIFGLDPIGFWIIISGALVAVSGTLLGNFLILRGRSLMGDAISHAILPGIALSFVITENREPLAMFFGALISGLMATILTESIGRYLKVSGDAAMGVVFTSFFALGVVIISRVASKVDLDPGCVLYGILESAALDTMTISAIEIPRIALTMAITTLAIIVFITLLWKELKIASFDPDLATTLGINATVIHYLLMAMVATFAVAAFEAVGSILVVAMIVVPPTTAFLLTDKMGSMTTISIIVAILSTILGRFAALHFNTSVPGMMSVAAGTFFLTAVFFGPKYGIFFRMIRQTRMNTRIIREDILAMLYRWHDHYGQTSFARKDMVAALHAGLLLSLALFSLRIKRQISFAKEGISLTTEGKKEGSRVVQGHRLWEAYLARHFHLAADHLHEPANRVEHFVDNDLKHNIASELDDPERDPHGRPIPNR